MSRFPLRPSLLALALSAAGPWSPAALAAPSYSFDIPQGPLGETLARIARQSGLVLSVDATLVGGLTAAPVHGQFEAAQAAQQALAGSGLVVLTTGNGTLSVTAQQNTPGVLDLGATRVNGQYLGEITENSGSYTTGPMKAATKLALSIRETPQSVTAITRQRIEDQQLNTLNDVIKSTPGMAVQELGPDRQRYYARGTLVDNLMYDGLPINTGGSAVESTGPGDLALYDHVEVVRGATGMMQGAGNPSASINLVRKKPTTTPQASLSANLGSWDRYRTEVDASGPLNDNASLRGRVVTAYQNYRSFQDQARNERGLFYGVFEADLNDDTTLTFGASRQQDNNESGWGGIPVAANGSDLHLPRSTFLGNDWESFDRLTEMAFAQLEHRFSNGWKLNLAANKVWSTLDQFSTKVFDLAQNNVFDQRLGNFTYNDRQGSYDMYASGPFELLGREHEFVFGLSKHDEVYTYQGTDYITLASNINPYNWSASSVPRPQTPAFNSHQTVDIEQKSLYSTTRLKLVDDLTLILGGRLDWYDYGSVYTYGTSATPTAYKVTRNLTKYAGLVYDLDEQYSLYASYTDIFKPQNYLDAGLGLLDPVVGKNYELGLKAAYFDGRLNASAALFRMNQDNRAKLLEDQTRCASYSAGMSCYEASGQVRSQGVDLELQGSLTPAWQVAAGYTYTEIKYIKDSNKNNEGKNFDTDLPKQLFKMTSTYTLPGDLDRWRVGASLYRQSKVYNKGSTYYIEQKAYNLVDLMLGYHPSEHLETQLNFNNVFDKRYYRNITDSPVRAESVYGEPRNLMLGVKYTF